MRAIRGRELRIHGRLLVRSLIPQAPFPPILLPILLPSLSAASTKRLIRSLLLPRPAFIRDFPRRRLDRGTRLLRHYFVASLARLPAEVASSASPEQTSSCSPSFLPSFCAQIAVRPSDRAPARPSVRIAPAPPHVLPQLSFVRRSVRPSPARSLVIAAEPNGCRFPFSRNAAQFPRGQIGFR